MTVLHLNRNKLRAYYTWNILHLKHDTTVAWTNATKGMGDRKMLEIVNNIYKTLKINCWYRKLK